MNIQNFIDSNTWTDDIDQYQKQYQYLIDWSSNNEIDFRFFVAYIEDDEIKSNVWNGYAYSVRHSNGRFKHTVIIRYKL